MVIKYVYFLIITTLLISSTKNQNINSNSITSTGSCLQKNPNFLPGRSGIVHLFEWKFNSIAKECELFLSKYGYGGFQVSPVNENIIVPERPWYERYQPMSYKLNTRSGNEEEFREMVRRCNNVGVRTYVDVVINHMSGNSSNPVGTGGSTADPGQKYYPDAGYNSSDFHETCEILDYQNATQVRNCELVGLHDLNQGLPNVRNHIIDFINKLIGYGIAGIRVDAAKHMWPNDLQYIYSQLNDLNMTYFGPYARPFVYQEVIDVGGEAIKATEYTDFGRVTDFRFGAELGRIFKGLDTLNVLQNFSSSFGLLNSEDSVIFIDNHDNQRGSGGGGQNVLTYKEPKQYKMAVAFMLAWPLGIPRLMSSYFFDDNNQGPPHYDDFVTMDVENNFDRSCRNGWVCEHRWRQIYNMIAFRNIVEETDVKNWWDNGSNQIAFSRGDKGFIAFNQDNYPLNMRLQTGLPRGYYCDIISGNIMGVCTGKLIEVDDEGYTQLFLRHDEDDGVVAIHINSRI